MKWAKATVTGLLSAALSFGTASAAVFTFDFTGSDSDRPLVLDFADATVTANGYALNGGAWSHERAAQTEHGIGIWVHIGQNTGDDKAIDGVGRRERLSLAFDFDGYEELRLTEIVFGSIDDDDHTGFAVGGVLTGSLLTGELDMGGGLIEAGAGLGMSQCSPEAADERECTVVLGDPVWGNLFHFGHLGFELGNTDSFYIKSMTFDDGRSDIPAPGGIALVWLGASLIMATRLRRKS